MDKHILQQKEDNTIKPKLRNKIKEALATLKSLAEKEE